VDAAGMYGLDGRFARGFVTMQDDGTGTIAGPPARVSSIVFMTGSAETRATNAVKGSRPIIVEANIFDF
jgi:hypothetical protein